MHGGTDHRHPEGEGCGRQSGGSLLNEYDSDHSGACAQQRPVPQLTSNRSEARVESYLRAAILSEDGRRRERGRVVKPFHLCRVFEVFCRDIPGFYRSPPKPKIHRESIDFPCSFALRRNRVTTLSNPVGDAIFLQAFFGAKPKPWRRVSILQPRGRARESARRHRRGAGAAGRCRLRGSGRSS